MVLAKIKKTTLITFYVQLLSRQCKNDRKEFIWFSVQNGNAADHPNKKILVVLIRDSVMLLHCHQR